jgi:hypothetical protein
MSGNKYIWRICLYIYVVLVEIAFLHVLNTYKEHTLHAAKLPIVREIRAAGQAAQVTGRAFDSNSVDATFQSWHRYCYNANIHMDSTVKEVRSVKIRKVGVIGLGAMVNGIAEASVEAGRGRHRSGERERVEEGAVRRSVMG